MMHNECRSFLEMCACLNDISYIKSPLSRERAQVYIKTKNSWCAINEEFSRTTDGEKKDIETKKKVKYFGQTMRNVSATSLFLLYECEYCVYSSFLSDFFAFAFFFVLSCERSCEKKSDEVIDNPSVPYVDFILFHTC